MALMLNMYKLLVNLPSSSSCFSKFVLALFWHVFGFLSLMKIPNLRDILFQNEGIVECFHFGKNG